MSDARLPRNARDIIDRLGPAVTLHLIRALGGTTIPVPMRLTPVGEARYRRLCDMIGEDAAKALCREYAGTNLYIPTCRQAAADERDAAIIKDRDAMAHAGLSEREIVAGLALKYGLSDRHVWRILKRMPANIETIFTKYNQSRWARLF